jgi:hypothetical protein
MYCITTVRSFYLLVVRVLVVVTLHGADYFCFGITVYEETVIVVLKFQVGNNILNV